jgi:hypothetical protein
MSRNIEVSEPKIAPETERALREEYQGDIVQLESLIGRISRPEGRDASPDTVALPPYRLTALPPYRLTAYRLTA